MQSYLLIKAILIISFLKNNVSTQNVVHLNSSILFTQFNYSNRSIDIELANKNIITIDPDTFNGFNRLNILNLDYNPLVYLNSSTFNCLINLEGLSMVSTLSHNNNTNKISSLLFNGLKQLKSLNLASNNFKQLDPDLFDGVSNLKILNIEYNQLGNISVDLFKKLNQLEQLNLQFNRISYLNSSHFKGLESLQVLDLSLK